MTKRIDSLFTYLTLRPLFKVMMTLFFVLEVEGADVLKKYPGAILAGNHTGFLDGPIILAGSKTPILFLVAQGVLSWPLIGFFVRWIGILTVQHSRTRTSLKRAIHYLKAKQTLCIFPEGELTRDGELGKFHGGVTFLHTQSQAPIIPFAIHGGYEAWRWGQWVPKFGKIYLKFGEPIIAYDQDKETILNSLYQEIQTMKLELKNRNKQPFNPTFDKPVLNEA